MLSDNLGRRLAASFGVIGYRSDSVKPKITKKRIFYNFFTISRFYRNNRFIAQNTSLAEPSSKEMFCIYIVYTAHAFGSGQPCWSFRGNVAMHPYQAICRRLDDFISKMILVPRAGRWSDDQCPARSVSITELHTAAKPQPYFGLNHAYKK